MAQNEPNPQFVTDLLQFHSDINAKLDKNNFIVHIRGLEKQFRYFAEQSETFMKLSSSDREALLTRNTNLFIHYVLASYINCTSGEEQLEWILDDNVPRNYSSQSYSRRIDFEIFMDILQIFKDDCACANEYSESGQIVANSDLMCQCNGLVANLLLYNADLQMELEGHTSVHANFIEALELLKLSHKEYGRPIETEPILTMVSKLEKMSELFQRCVDMKTNLSPSTSNQCIYRGPDLYWFRCGWSDMPMPSDLMREFSAFSVGMPVSDMFMPLLTRLFGERFRCMLRYMPEFQTLPEESQLVLWSRNTFSFVSLSLAKYESCRDGMEQFRFLAGSFRNDDDAWKRMIPNFDLRNLKRCGLAETNAPKKL